MTTTRIDLAAALRAGGQLDAYTHSVAERLMSRLVASETGCLVYTRKRNRAGYGIMSVNVAGIKRKMRTHRISYALANGILLDTFAATPHVAVCHRCDNPPCCNPDHLFLGTMKDNVQDMLAKGRANPARGVDSGRAVLTEAQVLEARTRISRGEPASTIARYFGCGETTVRAIRNGRTWRHVTL